MALQIERVHAHRDANNARGTQLGSIQTDSQHGFTFKRHRFHLHALGLSQQRRATQHTRNLACVNRACGNMRFRPPAPIPATADISLFGTLQPTQHTTTWEVPIPKLFSCISPRPTPSQRIGLEIGHGRYSGQIRASQVGSGRLLAASRSPMMPRHPTIPVSNTQPPCFP